jgi:hypothetical protein
MVAGHAWGGRYRLLHEQELHGFLIKTVCTTSGLTAQPHIRHHNQDTSALNIEHSPSIWITSRT